MHFTVKYSRNFARVYEAYDGMHHSSSADFAQILDKPDDRKLEEAFKLIHQKESIMLGFLDSGAEPSPDQRRILELIPPLREDYWKRILGLFEEWAPRLEKELNRIGPNCDIELERLLGIRPPKEYTLAIVHNFARPKSLPGQQFSNEPFFCLMITENRAFEEHMGVAIHELVHHLLRIHGWNRKFKSENMEEAFIKLLTPRGILTERIGIQKSDINKMKEERCDKEIDLLRPYFQEYLSSNTGETIFHFLERKKVL